MNSVYFGLTTPINNIEEAVFYLGIRQIRQLAMVTPSLRISKDGGQYALPVARILAALHRVAIMSREVISCVQTPTDDSDYVAGSCMTWARSSWPPPSRIISSKFNAGFPTSRARCSISKWKCSASITPNLARCICRITTCPTSWSRRHATITNPERAGHHGQIIAAVQIADLLVRHAKIGKSGDTNIVTSEIWTSASGWEILFPQKGNAERDIACAALHRSLERLPSILQGLV